jgi:hypothetical protein
MSPLRYALVLFALAAPAVPVAAQQVPAQPEADTVLTPQQRALQRLRALGAVAQPDTMPPAEDAPRAQQVRVNGRAAPQVEAPATIQRDSIMQRLMSLSDYIATEYKGDTALFEAQINRLELRGQPQVAREGSNLAADSLIVYDERIAEACGYGKPVLIAPGMQHPLVSEVVCFDVERQVAFARNAETTVAEGATWHLRGDVYYQGDDFYSHDALFTDCDLPFPHYHYHFGANRVKVVRDNVLVARNVTLNFADVPVFWLPFMVQSLSQGRRSGLLMPRFGINDIARANSRYSRRIEDVGFYWAINEYLGAELSLDWFSNNWTAINGSFDYNFPLRFFRGAMTYRHFMPEEGGRQFTLSTRNTWEIDERTGLSIDGNYTTSSRFVRERSFDPFELNRTIDSNASLRRRFDFGQAVIGANRRQQLSDNTTNWLLPSVSFNVNPQTLFEAMPGDERWFNNMNWQGIQSSFRINRRDIGAEAPPALQNTRNMASSVSSGLSLGRLSWTQQAQYEDARWFERTVVGDTMTTVRPDSAVQTGGWDTSLNFQQRLIGTSTFTPSVSIGGRFQRSGLTENEIVHAPMRMNFGATLRTDLFGFWGGVGNFERFRHRMSPSFSYTYSPAVRPDSLQQLVFSARDADEQSRLTIGLSQTIEGRVRAAREEAVADREIDAAADTAPRRRERAETISLLSISTDAVVYDFVRARRDGEGIVNTQISNSIQSDLFRGLQLSITHDLFRAPQLTPTEPPVEGVIPVQPRREFAPHLSRVNASFSINSDAWLFRVLGLGRAGDRPTRDDDGMPDMQDEDPFGRGPATDRTRSEFGMIGTSRRTPMARTSGQIGSWNADLTYTLTRPRAQMGGEDSQMLTGRFGFQPTENWTLRWNTGVDLNTRDFTDHILTLTRKMHDWDANFDFVKAHNGNFSFQFRVFLRANPDIKLDYQQNDSPAARRQQTGFQ